MEILNDLKFDEKGLLPAVLVDEERGDVLMLAYMNKEAFLKTIEKGKATFYSRSRRKLWTKGEESGNFMEVKEILLDCDGDALVVKVKPKGPACHKGYRSCFFRRLEKDGWNTILKREFDPSQVYRK
ncbi:MAG: phosphoribosyl-AMP cyclohydrolase [Elusimicrobia bacterium]|nr:phosphoribosyl-AMP cyclohydrolase [Elusimicrobiota bacterium]